MRAGCGVRSVSETASGLELKKRNAPNVHCSRIRERQAVGREHSYQQSKFVSSSTSTSNTNEIPIHSQSMRCTILVQSQWPYLLRHVRLPLAPTGITSDRHPPANLVRTSANIFLFFSVNLDSYLCRSACPTWITQLAGQFCSSLHCRNHNAEPTKVPTAS